MRIAFPDSCLAFLAASHCPSSHPCLRASRHIFGHTHLLMDLTIEGIRYIQWPLGTPREQKAQTRSASFGMACVYDSARGGEAPQLWTHWGHHYEL
jgi:hypothetical protein